jgi:hypothetical protein
MRFCRIHEARGLASFFVLGSLLLYSSASSVSAQQRPLRSPDAEVLPPGTMRFQVGFDFLQDVEYPLSGLSGDLTSVAVLGFRTSVGRMVELQMEGAVRSFLSVSRQVPSFVSPQLTTSNSTNDFGDISIFTKVRLWSEGARRPAFAFRFGYQMPTTNQVRGIGTNTSNLFTEVILQKHIGKLNLFGSIGVGILESPTANFTQNDVFLYGFGFLYPVHRRVNLLAEVYGRHSTRAISTDLLGTESRGQARFGLQILAGGFQWDFAGIAGLTNQSPRSGFTFGLSRDVRLFDYDRVK